MPLALTLLLLAPVDLRYVPKVGDKATYAMRASIDLTNQDEVRFTGKVVELVKSVQDGVVTRAVENTLNLDVLGVMRFGRPLASEQVERLDGGLVKAATVDDTLLFATARIDRLRAFFPPTAPLEVGSAWWHTDDRSEALKAPPFSAYSKLEGDEKIGARDAWRVSIDANEVGDEHPVHVKGMVWLDKADGSLVRGQWTIDGFSYNPTSPPGHGRYELSRMD